MLAKSCKCSAPDAKAPAELDSLPVRPAQAVIRSFFAAPLRVHRYRDAHTRMLRASLERLDGCD